MRPNLRAGLARGPRVPLKGEVRVREPVGRGVGGDLVPAGVEFGAVFARRARREQFARRAGVPLHVDCRFDAGRRVRVAREEQIPRLAVGDIDAEPLLEGLPHVERGQR